ncbi:MAG: sulfatase-like hydrolase/transferase [Candidatus Binatia bacterium]
MERKQSVWVTIAHLCTISSFTIAQPLFDLFSRNAEFFVIRNSQPIDIFLLVFTVSVLIPGIAIALLLASRPISLRVSAGVQYLALASFGALFALLLLKSGLHIPGAWLVSGACGLGVLAAFLYSRFPAIRMVMTVLTPAVVLFPGLFLFHSPVYRVIFPHADFASKPQLPSTSPLIVMVLFDEFPLNSLLDETRHIDDVRYPHFAALARDATWFQNATTVSPTTGHAIPAILTGKYPTPGLLPTVIDHPHNLFTWLGGSYDLKAFGTFTQLCPERLCNRPEQPLMTRIHALFSDVWIIYLHLLFPPDLETGLPSIAHNWMDFAADEARSPEVNKKTLSQHVHDSLESDLRGNRQQQFLEFVRAIKPSPRPTLFFLHILLPHSPYTYFPSGKMYTNDNTLPGLNMDQYLDDEWAVTQLYQRHLLQVGFVDTLLGQLTAHLKAEQLYDQTLLVIAADHGVSFHAGNTRREITDSNFQDILPVPLFIKAPQQVRGVISDAPVETIDVLPTLASLLGRDLPWPVDGQAAWPPQQPQRKVKTAFGTLGKRFEFSSSLTTKTYEALQRQIHLFGARTAMTELYKIGPYTQLLGVPVNDANSIANDTMKVQVDSALASVTEDPQAAVLPAYLTGHIDPPPTDNRPLGVAIAVNGTIQAVTRTWSFPFKDQPGGWSVVIDEHAFHPGQNGLEAFVVTTTNGNPVLVKSRQERFFFSKTAVDTPLTITSTQGQSFSVVAGAVEGWVDEASRDADFVSVAGWAANIKHGQPADQIVAFLNGTFLFTVTPSLARPDVAQWSGNPAVEHSGFSFRFSALSFPQSPPIDLRLFALSRNGVASELSYREDYPWREAPPSPNAVHAAINHRTP